MSNDKVVYLNPSYSPYAHRKKWDVRFIELAQHFSSWSRDPSTKIGSVAVSKDRQILSIGYNGFPRGINDLDERLNDRPTKYSYVVHAEKNLIYNACLNGISLKDSILYVYGLPVCAECAKAVVQVGVKRVVCGFVEELNPRWIESTKLAEEIFKEVNLDFTYYIKQGNEWQVTN